MIDRIRLSAAAKSQLITLKRRTGIQHYNSLCRYAICLSLETQSDLPDENLDFSGGLEIDWKVLAGDIGDVIINLALLNNKNLKFGENLVRDEVTKHIHRGLSLMISKSTSEIFDNS